MSAAKPRPAGKGVGLCPTPNGWGVCGCRAACAKCGNQLHTAIHMHVSGEQVGDPPFGHEFQPRDAHGRAMFAAALDVKGEQS